MTQIPKLEIGPYIDIALRRKWWIAVSFVVAILGGFVFFKISPEIFQASTLILVEPQKVPTSYVSPVVSDTVDKRLLTITQQVHSRTNLEKIIEKFDLGKEPEKIDENFIDKLKEKLNLKKDAPANQESIKIMNLVEKLRKKIKVALQGRGGNNAFEISFTWHDPDAAAQVTNFIAEKYIEENLNVREEMAMATTDFLEREASRIRFELEAKEKELEDFKKKHMGSLPSELTSNMSILNQLKEELNTLEKRLDTEKQMAIMLDSQARQMKEAASFDAFDMPEEDILMEEDGSEELVALEEALKTLRLRYTEQHPDIAALKRRIEMLKEEEDRREEEKAKVPKESLAEDPLLLGFSPMGDPMIAQKKMQQNKIRDYEKQIAKVKEQIEVYKDRVEDTTQVELAMTKILRDYETVKKRYEELLAKSLSARMAEELERRQKGEQFRIIDPAVAPAKPVSPDFKKIMLLAIAAGLGLGCGLAFLRETMDPCFYDANEIETELGTQVLISLPVAEKGRKERKNGRGEKTAAA